MILVTIKILVPRESHSELMQTIQPLMNSIRVQSGCLGASLCINSCLKGRNQAVIYLTEEWETQADVDKHLRSNDYAVLLGATSVLKASSELKFKAVPLQSEIEAVEFEYIDWWPDYVMDR